jgi:hypothetical protein
LTAPVIMRPSLSRATIAIFFLARRASPVCLVSHALEDEAHVRQPETRAQGLPARSDRGVARRTEIAMRRQVAELDERVEHNAERRAGLESRELCDVIR